MAAGRFLRLLTLPSDDLCAIEEDRAENLSRKGPLVVEEEQGLLRAVCQMLPQDGRATRTYPEVCMNTVVERHFLIERGISLKSWIRRRCKSYVEILETGDGATYLKRPTPGEQPRKPLASELEGTPSSACQRDVAKRASARMVSRLDRAVAERVAALAAGAVAAAQVEPVAAASTTTSDQRCKRKKKRKDEEDKAPREVAATKPLASPCGMRRICGEADGSKRLDTTVFQRFAAALINNGDQKVKKDPEQKTAPGTEPATHPRGTSRASARGEVSPMPDEWAVVENLAGAIVSRRLHKDDREDNAYTKRRKITKTKPPTVRSSGVGPTHVEEQRCNTRPPGEGRHTKEAEDSDVELVALNVGGIHFRVGHSEEDDAAHKLCAALGNLAREALLKQEPLAPTEPASGELCVEYSGLLSISVFDVFFIQDSMSSRFRDGRSLSDYIESLKSGKLDPANLPDPIRVIDWPGEGLHSLDHRRLYCLKEYARVAKTPLLRTRAHVFRVPPAFEHLFRQHGIFREFLRKYRQPSMALLPSGARTRRHAWPAFRGRMRAFAG